MDQILLFNVCLYTALDGENVLNIKVNAVMLNARKCIVKLIDIYFL
jgi:hypothetical protein